MDNYTGEKYNVHLKYFGIPKMLPFMKPHKKSLIIIVVTCIIFGVIDILNPVLQRYALNHFVMGNTLDTILPFIGVSLGLMAFRAFINYYCISYSVATELRINRDLRNRAFSHLQKLSLNYYNTNSVGYIHARVMSDVGRIGDLLSNQLGDVFFFGLYIIGSLTIMLMTNAKLAVAVLMIVPAISVFFMIFQPKLFALNRQVREINSKITGNFNEGITGAKTVKSLVVEDVIGSDFAKETSAMKAKSVQAAKLSGTFSVITNMASSVSMALILWKGGVIAAEEVGTFSMFMSYAQGMMEPIRWLIETLNLFVQGQVNIERYTRLIETVPNVTDREEIEAIYGDCFDPKTENWEEIRGDIEFENVDFKYPDGDEYILENFNLKIPFGTSVAIVGETGAGKSTLANLICRFYEPTAGRVLIDGKDSRDRSQLWLHSALGYVLQTPHLFSGTIRENLLYGNENAGEDDIYQALKMVSAEGVVERLEHGLDTPVGEGGDSLSTGEKQLLSFARAILANPRILILDEATASVDTITEQKIQSAINVVTKDRTSIVIAHRLSTIKDSDIILVVSDGKIIEQGKHDELLAAKGHYYKLWMRQYEDDIISASFNQI